jgi:hypothetical protein
MANANTRDRQIPNYHTSCSLSSNESQKTVRPLSTGQANPDRTTAKG